ncbi:TraM recognition domain-containing protein [Bradyrhizobium sp. DASA03068]|uniref:TraM recognition domain-containing protein n=1 Tax=Bradyrhizobium sp. BLXBL-01 TaxID=3395915 RepID=UPI003F71A366
MLFILDEFLSLGHFADFRNAIQIHASAGVRLWFSSSHRGSNRCARPRRIDATATVLEN